MKKNLSRLFVAILSLTVLIGICQADEKGPAEIVLKSTLDPAKKTKLAFFPHKIHQEKFDCGICHHAKSDDGKQIAYKKGQEIAQCESCHNTKSIINKDLETFKKAAHARCKVCHKKLKKEGKKAGPTKCKGCHRKDLK